jgi:hypothetical protein
MARNSTTWEEARRCPKCKTPGKVTSNRRIEGGSTLNMLECVNSRCKWFEQPGWGVEVRADGSVPVSTGSGMRPLPDDGGRTEEILRRQAEAMMRPGAEMPNR